MHSIALWPTFLVVTIAVISDIRSRRIPNWLVVPFLLAGVVLSDVLGGWSELRQSLLGLSLAAVLMGVLYCLGGMGMGDVKLCAAIGAWIGPQQLGFALVVMGITGGVMAVGWAAKGGFLSNTLCGAGDLLSWFGRRGLRKHATLSLAHPTARTMPYAPAIAVGTLFSFLAVR